MKSSNPPFETWVQKLIYLGGNLGINKTVSYVDIELFFVEGTNFLQNESRVTSTFLYWCDRYSPLLSPSKIRRILRSKHISHNSAVLGAIIERIKENPYNEQHWDILGEFSNRSTTKQKLIPTLQTPKSLDPHFKKFNLVFRKVEGQEAKFLKTPQYISNNCPELSYRMNGTKQIFADLKSYIEKNPKFRSLYEISKNTFNPKNRINASYRILELYKAA